MGEMNITKALTILIHGMLARTRLSCISNYVWMDYIPLSFEYSACHFTEPPLTLNDRDEHLPQNDESQNLARVTCHQRRTGFVE